MVENKKGFFNNLRHGLFKTSTKFKSGIKQIFSSGKKIDKETFEQFEELLINVDVGPGTAALLTKKISELKLTDQQDIDEIIKNQLAQEIVTILKPVEKPILITHCPHIIMVCGVNGNGKTTTVGKLAYKYKKSGKSVMIAACDTFRAAAIEQLKIWSERTNSPLISGRQGGDAASVAHKAIDEAIEKKIDILLIDTAGRLHTQVNLMEELVKIYQVIKKRDKNAPHDTILVLDATTGQNAYNQLEKFKSKVNITGLIITKLDGTAKAGVILGLAQKYQTHIHAIGIGEAEEDLQDFNAESFVKGLLDL